MVTSHPDHVLIFHQLFFNLWKIPFMFRYVLDRGICFLPLLYRDGPSIVKSDLRLPDPLLQLQFRNMDNQIRSLCCLLYFLDLCYGVHYSSPYLSFN